MGTSKRVRIAHIELHLAVLLFAFSGLFGKLISASPMTIVAGRTFFSAVAIFIGLKLFSEALHVVSKRLIVALLLSGVLLAVHWLTFFHAIQISTVAIGLVGVATFPIFVTLFEPLISRQRYRVIDIASSIIVAVGLILVAPSFNLSDTGTAGLLWALLSAVLFAILTLINQTLVKTSPSMSIAFFQQASAAIVIMPFLAFGETLPDLKTLWLLLILGVLCTAIPHTLFIKSLSTLKAQLASVVTGLEPIYGILFAAVILNEIPNLSTVIGSALVFGAIILAVKAHSISGNHLTEESGQRIRE